MDKEIFSLKRVPKKCKKCNIYINKVDDLIESCDSVFDAVEEEKYFLEQCKVNCKKNKEE